MSAEIVQAGYDELDQVAAQLGRTAAAAAQLRQKVVRTFEPLEKGGWQGRGAEAFSKEMRTTILPALDRMTRALEAGRAATLEIKGVMQRAEEEAARPFKSDGELVDRSSPKSSDGLRITGMQPITNGQLYISGGADGRDIHPSDAKQGNLGDCFFVTSLAVVAQQNPELIRRAIKDNGDGTYTVTFYKESGGFLGIGTSVKPVQVTVTPQLPTSERVTKGGNVPVNAHIGADDIANGKQEMWSTVMEQAYAQWKGGGNAAKGYAKLDEGGHTGDVLFALTGKESSVKDPDDYSLKELARMQSEGKAITLSSLASGDGGKKQLYQNGNLVTGHAYYVTGVDEANGTVTIQNPWGWDQHKVTIPYNQLDDNFRRVTVNPLK